MVYEHKFLWELFGISILNGNWVPCPRFKYSACYSFFAVPICTPKTRGLLSETIPDWQMLGKRTGKLSDNKPPSVQNLSTSGIDSHTLFPSSPQGMSRRCTFCLLIRTNVQAAMQYYYSSQHLWSIYHCLALLSVGLLQALSLSLPFRITLNQDSYQLMGTITAIPVDKL